MPKIKNYSVDENTQGHPDHMRWLVISRIGGMVASHLNKETALQHCDQNNRRWPKGLMNEYKTHLNANRQER